MRWAGAGASLLVVAALLWGSATPARACSVDEDAPPEDPLDKIHMAVEGRVTAWRLAGAPDLPDGIGIPIEITLSIENSYKRPAPGSLTVVEAMSLNPDPTQDRKWGIETDCGIGGLQADPTGSYVVVGLDYKTELRDLPNEYEDRLFIERYFFVGSQPEGAAYKYALAQVRRTDVPALPLALSAIAIPLGFVLAAAFVFPAKGSRA